MADFSYKNRANRMVVLRCIGPDNFFLERVLFPSETLNLIVPEDSRVEIWGNESYGPCLEQRLRVTSSFEEPLAA